MFGRRAIRWGCLATFLAIVVLYRPAVGDEDDPKRPDTSSWRNLFVTLKFDEGPLSDYLAALGKAIGTRIVDRRGEPDTRIKVRIRQLSPWKALDLVAEAAQARVYLYPRDGRIALLKREPGQQPAPVCYDGPVRMAIKRVSANRDLEGNESTYGASLEVAWLASLQPFFLETRPRDFRVKDDKGKLYPMVPGGSALAPVDGRLSLVFDLSLPAVPRSVERLGLVEGQLFVVAPKEMLTFDLGGLDKLAARKPGAAELRHEQGKVVCRVSKVTLAEDRWTVQVTLDYPPGDVKFDSYQSWVVNNEMTLVAKDGSRRLASAGYVEEASSERRAVVSYHFTDRDKEKRGRPDNWKVTYKTPAGIVQVPMTFSFKDVPLP
jgi:hypothetical protein